MPNPRLARTGQGHLGSGYEFSLDQIQELFTLSKECV